MPEIDVAWVRVGDWLVARDYLAPVGIGDALRIAAEQGCVLPSPALVDEIWASSDMRVEPHPRQFKEWTAAEMNDPIIIADQARLVAEAVGGRPYLLLAGSHKDVVRHNGRVGIYGWHRLNGHPIQPFYAGHELGWKDYSQGLRLVKAAY